MSISFLTGVGQAASLGTLGILALGLGIVAVMVHRPAIKKGSRTTKVVFGRNGFEAVLKDHAEAEPKA